MATVEQERKDACVEKTEHLDPILAEYLCSKGITAEIVILIIQAILETKREEAIKKEIENFNRPFSPRL